ncbi:Uncharacterised protein [uncultured archaeon]|nr:Uncharacterised protein [uncultured archaeon]
MAEEIGKIITNGIETYTKNLNICIPFILNSIISWIVIAIFLIIGVVLIFGSEISSLRNIRAPEALILSIVSIASRHIAEIAILVFAAVFIILLISSFFTAGAIGMARQAAETGKSELSTMMEAGKKNVLNLFLADIMIFLVTLAGIVFIVPGIKSLDMNNPLASVGLLLIGGLLMLVYLLILSVSLAAVSYALVIESLGPVDAILAGIGFFKKNKFDVILLILVTVGVAFGFAIIDQIMNLIPVIKIIWMFISLIIYAGILYPLITVWWVRLYMTRTGKQVYVNDLLAHPNDIVKSS